jgi:protein SCO1/2
MRVRVVLLRSLLLHVGVIALSACWSPREEARQYQLRGQILAVRPEANEVLIKHGDIKNFMPGMTMPFRVRDAALLSGKAAGDLVTATLVVGENEAWLATIDKTGTAPLAEAAATPPAAFADLLGPGDAAPADTLFVDQDAQTVSLSQWRGSAVVLTFIYTRCPLPQFCPLMDRRFTEIQRTAQVDPALRTRVRLLSVSFDPDVDTPARLSAHAARLDANSEMWRLVTAPRETVDRFAARFGVNVIREQDQTITHNLRTAVLGPDGRIVSIYSGSDWTPEQAVSDLRRALAQ